MSTETAGSLVLPYTAGGTVTQYRALKTDTTTGQCIVTSAITDVVMGVAQQTLASGAFGSMQTAGIAKLTASTAISVGAEVMPTASGAGKVMTSAGATAMSLGIAITAAAADGDIIEVLLVKGHGAANS